MRRVGSSVRRVVHRWEPFAIVVGLSMGLTMVTVDVAALPLLLRLSRD
jgi:hypothetical protein